MPLNCFLKDYGQYTFHGQTTFGEEYQQRRHPDQPITPHPFIPSIEQILDLSRGLGAQGGLLLTHKTSTRLHPNRS